MQCINLLLQTLIISPHQSSTALVDGLAGNIFYMSTQMYGNHILQKCLQLGSVRNASFLIYELSPHIFYLLTHRYGNYVLQRMLNRLRLMNPQHFRSLSSQILSRKPQLQHNSSAQHVFFECQA
ncbi:unnamed protein product [Microthlaspi erraticum]|uniref:PUM-HD domain-containing protein n=1 Tax=Microthlaspi erraticum TaxID=1685480 RepID=A0A6D2KC60_9BRAS|nr:unnamed protein product [Microthlaspi erraticum]